MRPRALPLGELPGTHSCVSKRGGAAGSGSSVPGLGRGAKSSRPQVTPVSSAPCPTSCRWKESVADLGVASKAGRRGSSEWPGHPPGAWAEELLGTVCSPWRWPKPHCWGRTPREASCQPWVLLTVTPGDWGQVSWVCGGLRDLGQHQNPLRPLHNIG